MKGRARSWINVFRVICLILVVVGWTAATAPTKQQDGFYFDPAPVNQDVKEGEEVRLRCDVSNRKMITFYWIMNGKALANTTRRFQEDSDLRILWVNRFQDNGSLSCIATNMSTGIALRSAEARLNILWIDKSSEVQLKQPKEVEEIVDSTEVILRCQADGNPEPSIEWYRNKVRLFSNDKIKFVKNRLRLIGVSSSDNGVYSCRARNVAGQIDSIDNFLLNIPGSGTGQLNAENFVLVSLVKKQERALFNCDFRGETAHIEWHHKQNKLISSDKYSILENGSLVINNIDKQDEGVYICTGVFQTGMSQSFASELQIAYLDPMTNACLEPSPSSPQVVPVNGKYSVRCIPPKGLPMPTVKWLNPFGVEVEQDRTKQQPEGILSLTNMQEANVGNYTCVAENIGGHSTKSVWIVVSVLPKISRPPLSIRAMEGETADFDCKVIGNFFPVTVINWKFEDKLLDSNDKRLKIDQANGNLKITNVLTTDEGTYACQADTIGQQTVVSSNAHLYVEKLLKFNPVPVNAQVELGLSGRISCRAVGRVPPVVHWMKDGRTTLPPNVLSIDGTLIFERADHMDGGNYTCYAANEQGTISATIQVDIVVKPRLKMKPVNTTVVEGSSVMLNCVAVGDPVPSISWDKNNKMNDLDLNRFKFMPNGSLSLSMAFIEDSAVYGCTASNSAGFVREDVFLIVVTSLDESLMNSNSANKESGDKEEEFNAKTTVLISVLSVAAYVVVTVVLAVYCTLRIRAKRLRKSQAEAAARVAANVENGLQSPSEQTGLMSTRDSSLLKGDTVDSRSHVSGISSQPSHSSNIFSGRGLDRFSFSRNLIQHVGMLGRGEFGDVVVAKAFNLQVGIPESVVMAKYLYSREDLAQAAFRDELEMYSKTSHIRFSRLIGLSREVEPILAVFEYTEWGILKQLLEAGRMNGRMQTPLPSEEQMLTICFQVAQGMDYLAGELHLTHKDLASRNILVAPDFNVKISCPCLCMDTFVSEYFLFHQHMIPLRWMPPEAVLEDKYSVKSDVWAFGVFIWEVYSMGCLPMGHKSNETILKGLKSGEAELTRPAGCPKDVWALVEQCHMHCPADRPDFNEILLSLGANQAGDIVL